MSTELSRRITLDIASLPNWGYRCLWESLFVGQDLPEHCWLEPCVWLRDSLGTRCNNYGSGG